MSPFWQQKMSSFVCLINRKWVPYVDESMSSGSTVFKDWAIVIFKELLLYLKNDNNGKKKNVYILKMFNKYLEKYKIL